jgi:hypothetical protein
MPKGMKHIFVLCVLAMLWLTSCSQRMGDSYVSRYQYLGGIQAANQSSPQFSGKSEYYLVVLVDARHLDYTSPRNYISTLSQGLFLSQDPNTGHTWVVLAGKEEERPWVFEGGHTGEFGLYAPRYFDEVVRLAWDENHPNPASYLFHPLPDGCLQYGSGGHAPTFAAAFPLTEKGYQRVRRLLTEEGYDFSRWGIRGPNCIRFSLACLASVGVELNCQEKFQLPKSFTYKGEEVALWSDPAYSCLCVETPELLEKRLWELVEKGRAIVATKWYSSFKRRCEAGEVVLAEVPAHPKRSVDIENSSIEQIAEAE